MTKVINDVVVQTDTFAGWLEKTNRILAEVRTSVVTTGNTANPNDTSTIGVNTTGNAFVFGVFGSNAISLLPDNNSDAFIRVMANSATDDSSDTGGQAVFQSQAAFNANVQANSITFTIDTSNVVSTGETFSITADTNTMIDTPDLHIKGTTANLDSNTINVTSNDLSIEANTTSTGANVYFNGVEFKSSSNTTVIDGSLLNVDADVDVDNSTTDINSTDIILAGNVANVMSTTVNIGNGTQTANIDGGQFNVSSNVYFTGSNNTFGDTSADFHTFVGNTTFGDSVNIDDQLTVGANVAVNTDDLFVDTTNQRVGINTSAPDHALHVTGAGAQTVHLQGTSNVSIVANGQSTFFGSENVVIKAGSTKSIALYSNNQTTAGKTVLLSANGNVGIGNNAPTHKLRVNGTGSYTNNLSLNKDAVVLNFGADNDVNLTHVADTGLLLNSGMVVQFRDSDLTVGSSIDGQLDIDADVEIEITSPTVQVVANTLMDIDADVEIEGTLAVDGNVTLGNNSSDSHTVNGDTTFGDNVQIDGTLTVDGNVQLGNNSSDSHNVTGDVSFDDDVSIDKTLTVTANAAFDTNVLFVDTTNNRVGVGNTTPETPLHVTDAGENVAKFESTDGTASIVIEDNASTANGNKITVVGDVMTLSTAGTDRIDVVANGNVGIANDAPAHLLSVEGTGRFADDVSLVHDGVVLNFGADSDVNLTHIHNDGLRINVNKQIQFRDSALSISSSVDGQLDIDADTELEIVAPTVDIDATSGVFISNDLSVGVDASIGQDLSVTRNASVGGTLDVTGLSTLDGGIDVNANNFNVDTSGNVTTVASVINQTSLSENQVESYSSAVQLDNDAGTNQEVLSFDSGDYHAAKILLNGRLSNSTVDLLESQLYEMMIVTDGTDVFLTTYGSVSTDAENDVVLFSFDAEMDSGTVRLKANTTYADSGQSEVVTVTAFTQLFRHNIS